MEAAMLDKLDDYARRPMRYRNIDGIWEMGIGFLCVMIVLLEKSLRSAPRNSIWHWRGTLALCIALLGFVVLGGTEALKRRVTYLRTGFVKYRGLAGKPWIAGLIAGVTAMPAALLFYLLLRHSRYSVTVALESAIWGVLYAFATKLDEAWRWVVLAVIVLGPLAISMLPLDRASLQGLPMAFMGLTLLVSGGIAFCLYLRRTQPSGREVE
jgi:hypothetical protein